MKATGFSAKCGFSDVVMPGSGGTQWNDVRWKADVCFHLSFSEGASIDLTLNLVEDAVAFLLVLSGSHEINGWFLWRQVFFRDAEIHCSRFDIAPPRSWSLVIFTAAMAPQKQWLSEKMVETEGSFRTFLGSSWSDEARVAYLEWNCNTCTGWPTWCGI